MLDEADLLFSYGYEDDLRALNAYVCGVHVLCVEEDGVCVCVGGGGRRYIMMWWVGDGLCVSKQYSGTPINRHP